MSWAVHLNYEDGVARVPFHSEGTTRLDHALDLQGRMILPTRAEITITSNYYPHFRKVWGDDSIWWLYGLRAGDAVEELERTVQEFGTDRDDDPWAATPGNAGYALNVLLEWAKLHPDATFAVY